MNDAHYETRGKLEHERRMLLGVYDVQDVSNRVIEGVMNYGARKHEPQSYRLEGLENHMEHAQEHMKAWFREGKTEDLTHLLCRVAMALWSLENDVYTPEGLEVVSLVEETT